MKKNLRRHRADQLKFSNSSTVFNRGSCERERENHMNGSLHVGLAALGAAIAVGRNPVAATKVLVQSILAIAFAEANVFYTLFLVK